MNKRLIAFLSILSILISLPIIPVHSMENGIDAPLDGRTVPIIVQPMGIVCTGFLYSERIVFTGGHCLHEMTSRQPFQGVQIGAPNLTYTESSKRISVV